MNCPDHDLTSNEAPDHDEEVLEGEEETEEVEEEEGTEICPVCDRRNRPGEEDHCSHFFGLYWESEIIWSNRFNEFRVAWNSFVDVYSQLADLKLDPDSTCKDVAARRKLNGDFLDFDPRELNPQDTSASDALLLLVEFWCGESITTTGMLSGSGSTLYLEDPSSVADLSSHIRALVDAVREDIRAGVFHRDEDVDDLQDELEFDSEWPPCPFVVVHWMPAVYGCRQLRFGSPDESESDPSLPCIEIPFVGKPLTAKGALKKAAVAAAITVLKRMAAESDRRMCLVLSDSKAHYVGNDGSVRTSAPPRGGMRMDHLQLNPE